LVNTEVSIGICSPLHTGVAANAVATVIADTANSDAPKALHASSPCLVVSAASLVIPHLGRHKRLLFPVRPHVRALAALNPWVAELQLALQVRATGAPYLDRSFALSDRVYLERDARIQVHERGSVPDFVLYPFLS
jgi:hypothetical protein